MSEEFQIEPSNAALFRDAVDVLSSKVHRLALNRGWWEDEETLDGMLEIVDQETGDYPETGNVRLLKAKIGKATELLRTLNTFSRLGLIVTEVAEAFEGERKRAASDKIPGFSAMEEELADVVIRCLDLAARRGYRLGEAIIAKHAFNMSRPYKHGGKAV